MPGHSYRVKLIHRPKIDLIRAKVWESNKTIADSGNVIDIGTDALKGGRLGVYCDSQELVTWSALSYRYILDTHIQYRGTHKPVNFSCEESVEEEMLKKLTGEVQKKVDK